MNAPSAINASNFGVVAAANASGRVPSIPMTNTLDSGTVDFDVAALVPGGSSPNAPTQKEGMATSVVAIGWGFIGSLEFHRGLRSQHFTGNRHGYWWVRLGPTAAGFPPSSRQEDLGQGLQTCARPRS